MAIITSLPILIQLAMLIFLVGLILFTHGDDITISFTILTLVIFTLLLYILATFLPWFSPAGPLHTPFSNLIPSVEWNGRYIDRPTNSRPQDAWGLKDVRGRPAHIQTKVDILAWIFANSKNDDTRGGCQGIGRHYREIDQGTAGCLLEIWRRRIPPSEICALLRVDAWGCLSKGSISIRATATRSTSTPHRYTMQINYSSLIY